MKLHYFVHYHSIDGKITRMKFLG
uniref:Uncharacterized protein n=1 Tax=Rhizophora mucronata TaxID=61149 RepID=A0A2P2NTD7_RHIMU